MATPRFSSTQRLKFTFNRYGIVEYPPGATFGPRLLEDFLFIWIIDGEVNCDIDGQRFIAPPNMVILARPGMRDAYHWDTRRHTRHGYFHFTVETQGAKLPARNSWPLRRQMTDGDVIRPLFQHLGWLLGSRLAGWDELAQGAMRQALLAFISGMTGTTSEDHSRLHPAIARVLEHVQAQWDGERLEVPTLGDLARVADVSKPHLTRLFNVAFECSPLEALRILRIDRAANFLTCTDMPIKAISEACGFSNPFHFSRCFRELQGLSPRKFRDKVRAGVEPPVSQLARWRHLRSHQWGAIPATEAARRMVSRDEPPAE